MRCGALFLLALLASCANPPLTAMDATGQDSAGTGSDLGPGADAGPLADAGPVADAGPLADAAVEDGDALVSPDLGVDGGFDSGEADAMIDAGPSDAGPQSDELLMFLDGAMFRYSTLSRELQEIGPTSYGSLAIISTIVDPRDQTVRAIVDFTATPRLATVDPCTGAVIPGPRIARAEGTVSVAEGLIIDDMGQAYASIRVGNITGIFSNTLARIDLRTGTATAVGPVTTLQNDLDELAFGDGVLYGLDVDTTQHAAALYSVDRNTGHTTELVRVPETLHRIAWDARGHRLLGTTSAVPGRALVEVDLSSGALIPIAIVHDQAQYSGNLVDAFTFAPLVSCPRELLVNPGFETDEPICGIPRGFGDWGVDYSLVRTATQGVIPRSGTRMLAFSSTNFQEAGGVCGPAAVGTSADVAQFVDVSGCAPNSTLELNALFTAAAGASPGNVTCLLRVYTGTIADFLTATPTAAQSHTIALDANPTTWQRCTTAVTVPAGSSYLAAYVSAGTSPRARFADDTSLRVTSGACP